MEGQHQARPVAPGLSDHLAAWGLGLSVTTILIVAPLLLMAFAITAAIAAPTGYIALTDEDRVVEWLQVFALAVAGVAFILVGYRGSRMGQRLVPAVHVLVGVASLVVALEEISWGQRVFGWATPALFDEINYQRETNLHNTVALESVMKLAEIAAGAYGTVLPVLAISSWAPQWLRSSLLVPPIALMSFFLIPFLHWSSRIVIDPDRPIARLSEAAELALFTGGALFAVLSFRRLARAADRPRKPHRAVGAHPGGGHA